MTKRYSKKRESILECLRGTKVHPDAQWVYEQLKPTYPDLSLGTVYRNLGELCREGRIVSVATVSDRERFDACLQPHAHAICAGCGKILDVEELDLPDEFVERVQSKTGFSVSYSRLQFVGFCEECRKKRSEN